MYWPPRWSPANESVGPDAASVVCRSFVGRMLAVMVLGVLLAQVVSNLVWVQQIDRDKEQVAARMAQDLAESVSSTVNFFKALPSEYRHIVLSQLRDMGGTRFFVSLNKELIQIEDIEDSKLKGIVVDNFVEGLRKRLGNELNIIVRFSRPDTLHVFNNETLLLDLPPRWSQQSLIYDPLSPPILVAQVDMGEGEWLYLAALLPKSDLLVESEYLPTDRLLFLGLLLIILLFFGAMIVRWLTRPLGRLAQAAEMLGRDIDRPPLEEQGPLEVRATAEAFNRMQERIQRFIADRERLFSAISHDLKTPITRLRLRAELLEKEDNRDSFGRDLEELERMVAGALECARGTDIHEKVQPIDIMALLESLQDDAEVLGHRVEISGEVGPAYWGKPIALKRCISNLIDNAIFYGQQAEVNVHNSPQNLLIRIRDRGPGIPDSQIDQVFEPYYRLEVSRNRNTGGTGLGLGIARNIVHAHGGEMSLRNRDGGGLEVELRLPRH
ncbi:HAMP domain-containing protein [Motiliproteus coralliicola]|uniref:histidine kinase n=1 Tax=Motiliproteus coralliicola TaxID=2283196 RepID=A0A369WRY1_9GAMM|nr:ATP-binding protein [Motiliproteus coralliicola]RDE24417.1 HAMP domain-containing protein [Motiliproteus coralliicola]